MAFWKKSDDPWDRKPQQRKQTETAWWENDTTPPETESEGPKVQSLGDSIKSFFGGKKEAEAPIPPETCPWCGKDMEWGCVTGGRDGVSWRNWKPRGLGFTRPEGWKEIDLLDEGEWAPYKTVWRCPNCNKMVLDAPSSRYDEEHPRFDGEKYAGGGGFTPDPKAYDNYKAQVDQWNDEKKEDT